MTYHYHHDGIGNIYECPGCAQELEQMKTEEGKLKDQLKAFLKERGAYFFMPVQTGYGVPSLDFIGCYKGYFFAIETKAPGKEPTPRQRMTLSQMEAAGAFVVWDYDFSNLKNRLEGFMNAVDHP